MRRRRTEKEDRERKESERKNEDKSKCCAASMSGIFSINSRKSETSGEDKIKNLGFFSNKIMVYLVIITLILMVFNQIQLFNISSRFGKEVPTGIKLVAASVLPAGVPDIYGKELGISYDDVNPNDPQRADQTISILKEYDEKLTLTGKNLDRYVGIASQISCEYCCGAPSIIVRREDVTRLEQQIQAAINAGKITEDQADQYKKNAGDMACGCAHSYAMRGLAKYLITEHESEFSDEQILDELGKWKTLFFPAQMNEKARIMKEKNMPFTYSNLGSNKYRGIEKGSTSGSSAGSMVGGC